MHILITRTDNIGDVILTFPVAAKLKEFYPDAKITMLARNYTEDIIKRCQDIDAFLSIESLLEKTEEERIAFLKSLKIDVFLPVYPNKDQARWAKKAGIPIRVGHIYRSYYLWSANRLIFRIKRKKLDFHQAQFCLQFLRGLGLPDQVDEKDLPKLIRLKETVPSEKAKALIDPNAFNLVLHPGTNGHTLEWPKEYFAGLMKLLPPNVKVFVTGSQKEGEKYHDLLAHHPNAVGVFGSLSLSDLTDLLKLADGVVVGSTGPLHMSAALGTKVIGLFPPQIDLNATRWGGIGEQVINIEAPHCEASLQGKRCECMKKITPEQVYQVMQEKWRIT